MKRAMKAAAAPMKAMKVMKKKAAMKRRAMKAAAPAAPMKFMKRAMKAAAPMKAMKVMKKKAAMKRRAMKAAAPKAMKAMEAMKLACLIHETCVQGFTSLNAILMTLLDV